MRRGGRHGLACGAVVRGLRQGTAPRSADRLRVRDSSAPECARTAKTALWKASAAFSGARSRTRPKRSLSPAHLAEHGPEPLEPVLDGRERTGAPRAPA